MGSGAGRESSTYGEAAVNEWTPVSCSARKFQSGHTGAARASEGSSAGAACQSSLTPPRRTAPREKRRVHSLYPQKTGLRESAHSSTSSSVSWCLISQLQTRTQPNSALTSARTCSPAQDPLFTCQLFQTGHGGYAGGGGTRPRHRQSRAQVQTQKKTCTPTQITAQSQTNLFLPPTCPRALP